MNQALQLRLRTIDWLLDNYGHLNRGVLTDFFGYSVPQASMDIQAYLKECPNNARYCLSTKRYVKLDTYQRHFP